jgi:hypothetical protein
MNMKIILTLFSLSLSFSMMAQSMPSLLKGTVCDTLGKPVEFAQIYICKDGRIKKKEITDSSGRFYIYVIDEENDIFIIKANGFFLYAQLCTPELIQGSANYFYLTPFNEITLYYDDEFGH